MTYAPTTIDLSRVAAPNAIEALDPAVLEASFMERFVAYWNEARATDPTLPAFTIASLKANPASIVSRVFSYLRLLDRARVNDAVRAVLAPLARRADLESIAASANVERLVVIPADASTNAPAVMESDAALLRRYLLAFDRPAAGSAGRYLYEAWTAWPGMGDVAVNGRVVHGRRGDTDVVVSGPGGRDATDAEMALVRAAVLSPNVQPEAVGVSVLRANRYEYAVAIVIDVPPGPDTALLVAEAAARIKAAVDERTLIGAEVPVSLIEGSGYGPNVIAVSRTLPIASIAPDPYRVPVCTGIEVTAQVRA
jgi:phage-related baseplate assembly protein